MTALRAPRSTAGGPAATRPVSGGPLPPALSRRYRRAVLEQVERALAGRTQPLYEMMRYHLGLPGSPAGPRARRTGKMLRPILCLLACEAVGGDYRRAAPAAAAIELLHNFTLVHDDIQDKSDSRHGRATVWRLWGPDQAINAGDGLYALSHLALAGLAETGVAPEVTLAAFERMDSTCLSLCEGQYLDLAFEERPSVSCEEYLEMTAAKTGSLMGASTALGALLGGASADVVEALDGFGRKLGLAFQVYDDLLGVWGDGAKTGKPSEDLARRKRSYPIVFALEGGGPRRAGAELRRLYADRSRPVDVPRVQSLLEAAGALAATRQEAQRFSREAIDSLRGLPLAAAYRQHLQSLAAYAVDRAY